MPAAIPTLAAASSYGFELRYYIGDNYHEPENWTEITQYITGIGDFWYGFRGEATVGFDVEIQGINLAATGIRTGRTFKTQYRYRIAHGVWSAWATLFQGILMPEGMDVDYKTSDVFTVPVTDVYNFTARKGAPVMVIGSTDITQYCGVSADSTATAASISAQGEFIGEPQLGPEQAVDGDMGTLWVSNKSPSRTEITRNVTYTPIANEVYFKTLPAYDSHHMWIEAILAGTAVAIMTRSGYVSVVDVSAPPEDEDGFNILTYSRELYDRLWGSTDNAPVAEWKNHSAAHQYNGAIGGWDLRFNEDGLGDFIALHWPNSLHEHPGGRNHHEWRVCFVVAGTKTNRTDGYIDDPSRPIGMFGNVASDYSWVDIFTATEYADDDLIGAFICAGDVPDRCENAMRYITDNTASVWEAHPLIGTGWRTRCWVEGNWEAGEDPFDYQPANNHYYKLRGYPFRWRPGGIDADMATWNWPGSLLDASLVPAGGSYRRQIDGQYDATWVVDESPTPGYSGKAGDEAVAWLMLSVPEFVCNLAAPLNNGETEIVLDTTNGMLYSGDLYLAGTTAAYTSKTPTTITLAAQWSGGALPVGTRVYQYEDSAATAVWPIQRFVAKRDGNVTGYDDKPRLLYDMEIWISSLESPSEPAEIPEEPDPPWTNDWGHAANTTGGPLKVWNGNTTDAVLEHQYYWNGRDYVRARTVMFLIRSMTDESQPRLNEVKLLAPEAIRNGGMTGEWSVQDTITWLVTQSGMQAGDVSWSEPMPPVALPPAGPSLGLGVYDPIGAISTDGSPYFQVIDDLARRTGHLVIANPVDFDVNLTRHPLWGDRTPYMTEEMTFDADSIERAMRERRDDFAIAQIQVHTEDGEGNFSDGYWPPYPRDYLSYTGQIIREERVYRDSGTSAEAIARFIWNERTQPVTTVTVVGPCPWIVPGQRVMVDLYKDGVLKDKNHYMVQNVTHQITVSPEPGSNSWKTMWTGIRVFQGDGSYTP